MTKTIPNTNIQGFTHAFQTLLKTPNRFLPNLTIPTFVDLPENLGPYLISKSNQNHHQNPQGPKQKASPTEKTEQKQRQQQQRHPQITALILDKDNTLTPPRNTHFPLPILQKLTSLRTSPTSPFNVTKNPHGVLIVSNRAGSHPAYEAEAVEIERQLEGLRIPVFRLPVNARKKPFCGGEVLGWFRERGVVKGGGGEGNGGEQVAVVGDRLGTDVVMAAEMGAWSVWCSEGVWGGSVGRRRRSLLEWMEVWVERYLRENKGLRAPVPRGYESM